MAKHMTIRLCGDHTFDVATALSPAPEPDCQNAGTRPMSPLTAQGALPIHPAAHAFSGSRTGTERSTLSGTPLTQDLPCQEPTTVYVPSA